MKRINSKTLTIMWLLVMATFASIMISDQIKVPMWQDEYVFYRITQELPSTATSSDWFFKDNPKTLYPSDVWDTLGVHLDRPKIFALTYNTPMYVHIPLANYLCWPIVKGLDTLADKGIIQHIEDNQTRGQDVEVMTLILRLIPISLFLASMWLIYRMLLRKVGKYALFMTIPMVASLRLLDGIPYFYWDSFMLFFFVLTLYLQDRNSKWAYLSACAMVNTKMTIGILLLIPLIIKDRKMIFCAFSLVFYYIGTIIVTHDWLWIFKHLLNTTANYAYTYVFWKFNYILNFGLFFCIIFTVPILRYIKKYPIFVASWIILFIYAWGVGLAIDKMSAMLYGSALVFPLIAYEMKFATALNGVIDKIKLPKIDNKDEML